MAKITKPNDKSHSLSIELLDFQKSLAEAGYVESTRKVYLRAFEKFAKRLDRKTPATAPLVDARRHLTELKQQNASSTAYGNASAALRFYFEEVRGIEWKPISPRRHCLICAPTPNGSAAFPE
jgi:site-specific recombinase XerD